MTILRKTPDLTARYRSSASGGIADHRVPEGMHLGLKICQVPRVVDHVLATLTFQFYRHLGRFSAGEFFGRHAAKGSPRQPYVARTIDKRKHVTNRAPAGLDEQRRIDHDCRERGVGKLANSRLYPPTN